MAAEFDTLPVLPGGVTARILQEDLEAITPPRSPLPNHLTQTSNFYCKCVCFRLTCSF